MYRCTKGIHMRTLICRLPCYRNSVFSFLKYRAISTQLHFLSILNLVGPPSPASGELACRRDLCPLRARQVDLLSELFVRSTIALLSDAGEALCYRNISTEKIILGKHEVPKANSNNVVATKNSAPRNGGGILCFAIAEFAAAAEN